MKRKSAGLKFFVFLIIFVMMFSVIGVVVIYLKGISAQEEASQKVQEQRALDNAVAPVININTEEKKEITIGAPSEKKKEEVTEKDPLIVEEKSVKNTEN